MPEVLLVKSTHVLHYAQAPGAPRAWCHHRVQNTETTLSFGDKGFPPN